jgi:low temperature requirement protein LtrA
MDAAGIRERVSIAGDRLVRPPVLRTAEDDDRSATWTELFFDLVFVAAISRTTTILIDDHTASGITWFLGIMVLIVWSWTNFVLYSERFDTDDVVHRLLKAFAMASIAGVALFAPKAPTSATFEFAFTYALTRLSLELMYLRAMRHVRQVRGVVAGYVVGFGISCAIWIASLAVPDDLRPWLWMAAGVVELATPLFMWRGFGQHAFALDHLSERFGQFMLIVLGEAVVGIVAALSHVRLEPAVVVATAGSAILVFSIWWHNFDFLQRHVPTGHWTVVYIYGAVPVFIAITALGATLDLAIEAAGEPLAETIRWLSSASIATYLVIPTAIQVGGTPLELDVATVTRLVAAAAVVALGWFGAGMSAASFVLVASLIVLAQLVIEIAITAGGLRDHHDDGS